MQTTQTHMRHHEHSAVVSHVALVGKSWYAFLDVPPTGHYHRNTDGKAHRIQQAANLCA